MTNRASAAANWGIYTLLEWGAIGTWTDGQLLGQFVTGEEAREAAFRVLIHRHGPLVMGVCRRVLGDEHSAEDAFQATFLILVKKAGSLENGTPLTNWLYGVALRVANKERVKGARRRYLERRAAEPVIAPDENTDLMELRSVIDEEIRRLPERYRIPLLLCHVQGLRHDEVARQLGCPVGTVESRLSRARQRLRTRLTRRGLAPASSTLGALLRPPGQSTVIPPLFEETLRAVLGASVAPANVGTKVVSLALSIKHICGSFPIAHAFAVASTLVAAASVSLVGVVVYRTNGEPASLRAAEPRPATSSSVRSGAVRPASPNVPARAPSTVAKRQPTIESESGKLLSAPPTRPASAVAIPLTGITLDGRLDDWPRGLARYPIANQLRNHPSYNSETDGASKDQDAYFMAGYDSRSNHIYLAVVIHDRELVVHPTSAFRTDAVEIYIDGTPATGKTRRSPAGNWLETLSAATMPVLQYVAVPGQVPAYGDPWNANPSLVYARTKQTKTNMQYHHVGEMLTYEWSIAPFDRFPDEPTKLYPGKRLGLDVAVVDQDGYTKLVPRLPTFLTWGSPPSTFKGTDPDSLGELILIDTPAP
jgi:RNA polymerase sigma factor (sigma-70 family)